MSELHEKIKAIKLQAKPVTRSSSYVDENGNLVIPDFKVDISETDRTVKGYLAVFGLPDDWGTVPVKGCFAKSIEERGPQSSAKNKICFLYWHDVKDPIGQFTVLKEDDYGLYFEAELDDVPSGERALRQIKSGTLNQFSYGFDYVWEKMEYREADGLIYMYEVVLWEGSVLTFASQTETYAIRSKQEFDNQKELLDLDTEDFIKNVPRTKQLELRQLIARHISLAQIKPDELRQSSLLTDTKPDEHIAEIGGYKLSVNQFI